MNTADSVEIKGVNFDDPTWSYSQLFSHHYLRTGFQASHLGEAIDITNRMLEAKRANPEKCKIFLGYTSNMISCGVREVLRFLVQHRLVDCIVTTAGGIEEDFIKCLPGASTFLGSFDAFRGAELRKQGLNRIGNLVIPNENYCKFEDWLKPILDTVLQEQKEKGTVWSPSKLIRRLGQEINHPDSVYYWAARNDIPVFCPAITDGSLGDMIFFHSYRNPGLVLDIVQDIRALNGLAMKAEATGMLILGGGVVKHHICNANLMRNGADYAVYINTGQEFDGSDSGARPGTSKITGLMKRLIALLYRRSSQLGKD